MIIYIQLNPPPAHKHTHVTCTHTEKLRQEQNLFTVSLKPLSGCKDVNWNFYTACIFYLKFLSKKNIIKMKIFDFVNVLLKI